MWKKLFHYLHISICMFTISLSLHSSFLSHRLHFAVFSQAAMASSTASVRFSSTSKGIDSGPSENADQSKEEYLFRSRNPHPSGMWQHPQHHRLKVRHIPPGVLPPPPEVISPDQTFYFIRHGLTEMNEVLQEMEWGSPGFHDKGLWDTRLSSKGIQQAIVLHRQWRAQYDAEPSPQSHVIPWEKIDLVLASPMLRALQTFSLLNEHSPPPLIRHQVPKIAHPLLRERLYLSSDVGSPRSIIEPAFPNFDFSALPEDDAIWWYHPDCLYETSVPPATKERNMDINTSANTSDTAENGHTISHNNDDCASQPPPAYIEWRPMGDYLCAGEPADVFKERLIHLRHWLLSHSQSHIVVVAHWGIIRGLTGGDFQNCEIRAVRAMDLLPEPFIDP